MTIRTENPIISEEFLTKIGNSETPKYNETMLVKHSYTNDSLVEIKVSDILLVEGLADYVIIETNIRRYVHRSTMKDIYANLPVDKFARIHRSFIVNITKIQQMEKTSITIVVPRKKFRIPIGRVHKKELLQRLGILD